MNTYGKVKLEDLLYRLEAFAPPSGLSARERKEMILSLRAKHMTYAQIAPKVGCTVQSCRVLAWRQRHPAA